MFSVREMSLKPAINQVLNNPNYEATQAFYPSLIQSFTVIFLSEIADKTFILVLIFSLKMHWLPLIITSMLAMAFMNILAIAGGYAVILFIPKNVIDWIGFCCFLFFGLFCVYEGLTMESKSIKEEYEEEKINRNNTNKDYQLIDNENQNKEIDSDNKSIWALCAELFGLLCINELGDRSQISTVTIAAVYNLSAVLIGTMVAYFVTIIIATFLGHFIGKFLTEKMMTIIGGFVFIGFACQIAYIKYTE